MRTPLPALLILSVACGGSLDDKNGRGLGGQGGETASGGAGATGGTGGGGGGPRDLPDLEPGWNEIDPGGDTLCSLGTDYAFWARPGTTNKVVIDFIGGGACWNQLTCAAGDQLYTQDVESVRASVEADDPHGIYDHDNADNPFADYYHVIVPYCTGDIHWGNNDPTYGSGANAMTIHHRGAVNARAVLDWVYQNFASPDQIVVTGCSAGSYGSALWSAHVMDHYPDSRVFQFGDSGAGIITDTFFMQSFPSWKADGAFPAWIPELDPSKVDIQSMGLNDLYANIASFYPARRMSQYDTFKDENQIFYFQTMGGGTPEEWSAAMQASLADIEARTDNFASFVPGGEQHCIIPYDNFYTVTANGKKLTDWLRDSIDGNDVQSEKCQGAECDGPTP